LRTGGIGETVPTIPGSEVEDQMRTRFAVTVLALLVTAILVVAAQRWATPPAMSAGTGGGMEAIGSVKDIMIALTVPTSTDVFNAASEPPRDDENWTRTRHQALALAESSNLLLMPDRSRDRADWNAFAIAQRRAAVVAMKAAENKDADALSNASDALYETCENCHKQYLPGEQSR
jgi:hypothetical protein